MFGIGSAIKDAFRDAVPNELADIAVKAAPFVAPFNPAIAATMAGLGSFDKTGRIGSSLKSAGKTYVGGQIARGIGGAPTQLGFTQPGTGNMFTSPFTGDALFGPEGSLTSTGEGNFFRGEGSIFGDLPAEEATSLPSSVDVATGSADISTIEPIGNIETSLTEGVTID